MPKLMRADLIEAAFKMGAKENAIKQWKKKGRRLPDSWRTKLSTYLGISVEEVLGAWNTF